ncbi:DUF317 domain-containing protein [Kitasatospora sp. NA04385]|uniref:DUF317 domain-containing protein n=1 Tax=Kitasatospora sp. NA04385 TaxID=2742135 RepID=UPI0015905C94|nr:DUF317 domain-containing protein [Kitasatospora sp. NA04385]QKW20646.1 DUF317 domain-containing protein [Kitasatospora sp. NA04385]
MPYFRHQPAREAPLTPLPLFTDAVVRAQDWYEPDNMVHVTPRYLAGSENGEIDTVLRAIPEAYGWHTRPAVDGPAEYFTPFASPCERIRMGFRNDHDDPWQIVARSDAYSGGMADWQMAFGWHTPPEMVAAALDEVATVLEESNGANENRAFVRGGSGLGAMYPFALQGWSETVTARSFTLASPDRLVTARLALIAPPLHRDGPWRDPFLKVTCESGDRATSWTARFTANVPLPVLHAFASAVASPEPLLRNADGLPERLTAVPVAAGRRAAAATGASPTLVAAGGPKTVLSAPPPSSLTTAAPRPAPHR